MQYVPNLHESDGHCSGHGHGDQLKEKALIELSFPLSLAPPRSLFLRNMADTSVDQVFAVERCPKLYHCLPHQTVPY